MNLFLSNPITLNCFLSDRIEEADVDVQTDAFLDRPPSPLFIPQSTGKDIATQIEQGDVNQYEISFLQMDLFCHLVIRFRSRSETNCRNLSRQNRRTSFDGSR